MAAGGGGNHFRSISFLAVAGMISVPQVGLQRPLEAPFRGSRSRVLAAARACVQGGLLHRAWRQHHTQETARPGKAGVRPANPSLCATLPHNLTCIWSFPGSKLAGWERQHTPGSWTNSPHPDALRHAGGLSIAFAAPWDTAGSRPALCEDCAPGPSPGR